VLPEGVPGDYNSNGVVDAADYVVWKNAGSTATLPNDSTPGVVDASDYATWQANFGKTSSGSGSLSDHAAVPEPALFGVLAVALFGSIFARRPAGRCR
jgi:hypothetical protein